MSSIMQRRQLVFVLLVFEIIWVVLFWKFCDYNDHALPDPRSRIYVNTDYPLFQDIHVMTFVGYGYLMAFLKRYGFTAISVSMMLSAFVCQLAILWRGILTPAFAETGKFTISIEELMTADLSCVPVLVSMGVLLGRFTPVQFVVMSCIETALCIALEHGLFNIIHINDGGRSMVTHAFGAYFGLACSFVSRKKEVWVINKQSSTLQHSELFSLIGTMFLWIFFPSFNAAAQEPEDARHRAIMNTYLCMSSCTVTTFMMSSLLDRYGRFNMMDIQSSTLSGGVAIGSVANAILFPYQSLLIGILSGILSVLGHRYISPWMQKKLDLYDTCGVHNLHGLPGILSGLCSIVLPLLYDPVWYGSSLYHIYPYFEGGPRQGDRDMLSQSLWQIAGMMSVIVVAVFGGVVTGGLLRFSCFNQVDDPIMSTPSDDYADVTWRTNWMHHIEYNNGEQVEDPLTTDVY